MLITAAVLFLPANVFPLFALEARGARISATLWGIVQILVRRDMPIVALMVFATAMLAPALQIAAMLYLLLPLRGGRVPVGFALVMRWVERIRQWNMAEVFMVGALVSVTRLSSFATLTPDVALWAYGGLTLSLAAASASFDPADLWNRADRAAARSKP